MNKITEILKNYSQSWFSEDVEMEDETSFVSFNDALLAMEAYAAQFQSSPKWVRADEREPKDHGYYHCEMQYFHNPEGVLTKVAVKFDGEWVKFIDNKVIRWLDESNVPPQAAENVGYDLEKLYEWLMDENRKPSITAFTSGLARNIAAEVEFRLSKHYPTPLSPVVKEEGKDGLISAIEGANNVKSIYYDAEEGTWAVIYKNGLNPDVIDTNNLINFLNNA